MLGEKSEGKRRLGRRMRRLGDDINLQLKGQVYEFIDSVYLTQDRVQWMALVILVMNLRFPRKAETVSCIK
jgi:hypothetical protein